MIKMPAWLTPKSVYDKCGEEGSGPASNTIDGNLGTAWSHALEHSHWIKYDLGANMEVSGIRVYADGDYLFSPCLISAIYVSTDPADWGSSLGSLTIGTTLGWHQTIFTAKIGRYIYLTIHTYVTTCGVNHWLSGFYEFAAYCKTKPKSHGYIFG